MTIRNYSNIAAPVQFSSGVDASDTLWPVTSTANYPDPPFTLGAERGTANEEFVLCLAKTINSFTVERGYDGTNPAIHVAGTSVEHCSGALDFREANAHINDVTSHTTLCTSTTRPTLPGIGQRIYETDTGRYYTWSGLGNASTGWLPDAGTLLDYQYYASGNTVPAYSDTVHGFGHALPPHCQWTMPALPVIGVDAFPGVVPSGHRVKVEFFARSSYLDNANPQEGIIALLQPASPLSFGGSFEHAYIRTPAVSGDHDFLYVSVMLDNDRVPAGAAGAQVNLYSSTGRTGASSIYWDCPMWMAVTMV